MKLEDSFELIRSGKDDEALKIISGMLMNECIGLIKSRSVFKDDDEAANVFYHSFLNVKEDIRNNICRYKGEKAFRSYFKTACFLTAQNFMRIERRPDFFTTLEEVYEHNVEFSQELEITRQEEYQRKKQLYGIDLFEVDAGEDITPLVIEAFHSLSEKCKFVIVMSIFLNLSHKEIAEASQLYFEIANADVSKSTLNRCLKYIRQKLQPLDLEK
jgi:hypothetical protein